MYPRQNVKIFKETTIFVISANAKVKKFRNVVLNYNHSPAPNQATTFHVQAQNSQWNKKLSCYICNSMDHLANRCPRRSSSSYSRPNGEGQSNGDKMKTQEKRVNLLCIVNLEGTFTHQGDVFNFSFDFLFCTYQNVFSFVLMSIRNRFHSTC